jgi:hypothetical protein
VTRTAERFPERILFPIFLITLHVSEFEEEEEEEEVSVDAAIVDKDDDWFKGFLKRLIGLVFLLLLLLLLLNDDE